MSPSAIELSIVVPAFNEENRLPSLLGALRSSIDIDVTEIIVVDDGSEDRTADVAQRALAELRFANVGRLAHNRGKGAAVRAGVLAARGRIVVYMDADLATDLGSLDALTGALVDAEMSIGSRAHQDSVVEGARLDRTILGRTFNRLTRALTGFDHLDTQCGFKAFHRPVAKLLFSMSSVDGFAFDVEILHLAHRLGLRVAEVPVQWQHVDGSKIRPWSDSFRMAADLARLISRRPTLEITGLRFERTSGSAVEDVLMLLDERLFVSRTEESMEVLLTPTESNEVDMSEHFCRHGMVATPVVRDCAEFLGPRRRRELALG